MYGFVEEQLTAAEDIRANGAVDFSLREIHRLQGNIQFHDYKTGIKTWLINNITGVTLAAGLILAVTSGYLLYSAALVTIGTVYLFVHYINLLEQPIWTLTHQVQSFQTIGACVERLSELRKLQPKVQDAALTFDPTPAEQGSSAQPREQVASGSQTLPDGPLTLDFQHVSFSYNAENTILDDLTFQVQPNSVLGLLGRTGSGKSTLTRLIFRLYDPTAGTILANGHDLRGVGLHALRRRIGVVTQEVQLFRASVRDNLTFFDRSIPDARIHAVLDELELGEWVHSLANGLDTELQTGGHSLSAGEAQLLAFARIFLRDPGLVILDEASSRLDPATEQRIERAIDRLVRGRTAIIVAHRLGTVHRASEIMILDDGHIIEHGSRQQLAADSSSKFARLLQTGMEEVLA
jgi:ATP-binding cassette subfamily B protein